MIATRGITKKQPFIVLLMLLAMIVLLVCSTSQQASGTCDIPTSSTYIKDGCQPGGPGVKYHIMVDGSTIRRSYLTFDISGVSFLSEVKSVTLDITNESNEGGIVGVYLMPTGGCPDPPSGDMLAQLEIDAKTTFTFILNKDLIPWSQDSFVVCLAMTNEASTSKLHVDFKNPCLEITYDPCSQYDIHYDGRSYANGQTTFTYTVSATSFAPYAVSHWVLALPTCIDGSNFDDLVVATNYSSYSYVGPDPTTGLTGIKFDETSIENGSQTFWFTLRGDWPEASTQAATKSGSSTICYKSTTGPACPQPGIHIEKSTNGHDADTAPGPYVEVGDSVTWTYVVTNTGAVPLSNIKVTDDRLGVIAGPSNGDTNTDGKLDTGEIWTYQATGTATLGGYENKGTVTGEFAGTPYTDDDLSHYTGEYRKAKITLDPPKATNEVGEDHVITATVQVWDGTSWIARDSDDQEH